jgi:hypothetical protein
MKYSLQFISRIESLHRKKRLASFRLGTGMSLIFFYSVGCLRRLMSHRFFIGFSRSILYLMCYVFHNVPFSTENPFFRFDCWLNVPVYFHSGEREEGRKPVGIGWPPYYSTVLYLADFLIIWPSWERTQVEWSQVHASVTLSTMNIVVQHFKYSIL